MAINTEGYPEHHKFLATPDAVRLAELYLLQADLKAAHETLSLYIEKFPFSEALSDEGRIISASLFRDSILLFCSCFSTREPNKLEPKEVFGQIDGWEELYGRIHDTRDAFVAHNFGPLRQHNIVVICLEIAGELVPAGFTQVYLRFAGWLAEEAEKLLSFIDVARDHLKGRIEEAEQPILKALETITSEELAALGDGDLALPGHSDIRSSRSRFRESRRGERVQLPPRRWSQVIVDASGARPVPSPEGRSDELPPGSK